MSRHYLNYKHLLKTESKLEKKAPLELVMMCFGKDDNMKVSKEVAVEYSEWVLTK